MEMEVNEFVSKFHSIGGTTISEKQKNFNILLENIPANHASVIASITPGNHLEHIFKLKLLIKLQNVQELLQILKNEDEHLPAKLLKNKWFCQRLAAVAAEHSTDFVNEILPFTTYVIRRRIITKLALYGTDLDAVYEKISSRYGIHAARNLLASCSSAKVESILQNQNVALTPFNQKLLYMKHPHLIHLYCKKAPDVDDLVLKHIACKDLNLLVQLVKQKNCHQTDLGKHLTKRLVAEFKETLICEAEKFTAMLHPKTLIRRMSEDDLKRFFFNSCPSELNDLKYSYKRYQNRLGNLYYKFLQEVVTTKYNKSIYDIPDLINADTMAFMDVDERQKWIVIKKKCGDSEDDLIPFMNISDAVTLIKKKINLTSSGYGRGELLGLLVKCCKVNKDLHALAEVCQYVCQRHRNDDKNILVDFLYKVQAEFALEKLGETHWTALNTIIHILDRQGDESYFRHNFYIEYLGFLFREKKLTDEKIVEFLKLIKRHREWNYDNKNQELRKLLLTKTMEINPVLINTEKEEKLEYADLRLLSYIFQWNKEHPDEAISAFEHPRLIDSYKKSIKIAMEEDSYISELCILNTIFENIICTDHELKSNLRDEAINFYFQLPFRFYNLKIDFWLLKHQPHLIEKNFDKFLKHLFNACSADSLLFNHLKIYTDSSFHEKIVNHCLKLLAENDKNSIIFHALAVLEPPNKFLDHIVPFYPSQDKIGEDEESGKRAELSIAVAKSFRFTNSCQVLPTLITYCKGDFLRYALESLYYLFYHSPENQLSTFVKELSSKAVSVRKHSIFLTCIVGTVSDIEDLLKSFLKTEKNVSVQKHLFTAALKFFIKNPSDDFWDCLKVCMTNLDSNDSESFRLLLNLHEIPQHYQARHVVFVWELLKKNEDLEKKCLELLSTIPFSLFKHFALEFLEEVIKGHFLKTEARYENTINNFVVHSLIESDHKNEIMNITFQKITDFKSRECNSLEEEKKNRGTLSCFVSTFTNIEAPEKNHQIFKVFFQKWSRIFTTTEAMSEHLKLSFILMYIEADKNLIKFASEAAVFLENLIATYGILVLDCFASELKQTLLNTFMRCYGEPSYEFYVFCLHFLKNWQSLIFQCLVIKLLPSKQPSNDDAKKLFDEIVHCLKQVQENSVQLLLNLYILDME